MGNWERDTRGTEVAIVSIKDMYQDEETGPFSWSPKGQLAFLATRLSTANSPHPTGMRRFLLSSSSFADHAFIAAPVTFAHGWLDLSLFQTSVIK